MGKPILSMKTKTKGGKNFKRFMRRARAAESRGVDAVQAGFFADAGNSQDMPITNIAALNEFGARRADGTVIPERPFMRRANERMKQSLPAVVARNIDPATGSIDTETARAVGETMKTEIQESIEAMKQPPNAPITRRRKDADNPLVDTGAMIEAVSYEIQE